MAAPKSLVFNLATTGGKRAVSDFVSISVALDTIKKKIAETKKAIQTIDESGKTGPRVDAARNRQLKNLRDLTIASKALDKEARTASNAVNVLSSGTGSLNALKAKLDELIAKYKETNQVTKQGQKQAKDILSEIAAVKSGASDLEAKLNASLRPKSELGPYKSLQREIDVLITKYQNLSNAEQRSGQGASVLAQLRVTRERQAEVDRAIATTDPRRSNNRLGELGKQAIGGLQARALDLFVAGLVEAGRVVVDFEQKSQFLKGILQGDLARNFDAKALPRALKNVTDDLKQSAIATSTVTKFAASDVVKLQTELAKLGFSASVIKNLTLPVANLATALEADLGEAAELVGATMKTFAIDSQNAERVVDLLTQAANQSALSFKSIAIQLPVVGSAAKTANVSLEETLAVLGVLADRGVQASTASTAFRNILIESANRGFPNYKDALGELNLVTFDYENQLQSLQKELALATTEQERTALATKITAAEANLATAQSDKLAKAFDFFGKRGAVQALILSDNMGDLNKQMEQLQNVTAGATKRLAALQLETLAGKISLLKNSWNAFILDVEDGNGVLGKTAKALIQTADGFISVISALNKYGLETVLKGIASGEGEGFINKLTSSKASLDKDFIDKFSVGSPRAQEAARESFVKKSVELSKKGRITTSSKDIAQFEKEARENLQKLEDIAVSTKIAESKAQEAVNSRVDNVLLQQGGKVDFKSFKNKKSFQNFIDAIDDDISVLDRDSPKFEKLQALSAKAKKEFDKVFGGSDREDKEKKTFIDIQTEKVNNYYKLIQETNVSPEKREFYKKEIQEAEAVINKLTNSYREFAKQSALTGNAPTQLRDDALAIFEKDSELAAKREEYNIKLREGLTLEQKEALINISNAENELKLLGIKEQVFQKDNDQVGVIRQNIAVVRKEIDLLKKDAERVNTEVTIKAETERLTTLGNERGFGEAFFDKIKVQEEIDLLKNQLSGNLVTISLDDQKILDKIKGLEQKLPVLQAKIDFQVSTQFDELNFEFEKAKILEKVKKGKEIGDRVRNSPEFKDVQTQLGAVSAERFVRESVRNEGGLTAEDGANEIKNSQLDLENSQLAKQISIDKALLKSKEVTGEQKIALATKVANAENQIAENLVVKEQLRIDKRQEKEAKETDREIAKYAKFYAEVGKMGDVFGQALEDRLEGDKNAFKKGLFEIGNLIIDFLVGIVEKEAFAAITKNTIQAAGAPLNPVILAKLALATVAIKTVSAGAKVALKKAIFEKGGVIGGVGPKGGLVKGPSHTQGGVPFTIKSTKQQAEMEGGEFVIRKNKVRKNLQLLEAINTGRNLKFETGGIIANPPLIVPSSSNGLLPANNNINIGDVLASQYTQLAQLMQMQQPQLVDAIADALDKDNRLSERKRLLNRNNI